MSNTTNRFEPIPTTPPAGWERETPKYKVIHETHPSGNSRFKFEPPHSFSSDGSYQYGERILKSGEVIETRSWPHAAFFPLNEAAKRVLQFFNSAQKSRLPLSPYDARGRLRLDTGLGGPLPNMTSILKPRGDDRLRSEHPNAPRPAA